MSGRGPLGEASALLIELFRRGGWLPAVVVATHFFLARGLEIYGPYPWLDMPMHFTGGVAIAFFIRGAIQVFVERGSLERPGLRTEALLVVTLTATAAMFWEFAEYTSDRLGWSHAQVTLGDTMLDMALGFLGGIAFVAAGSAAPRGRPTRGPT